MEEILINTQVLIDKGCSNDKIINYIVQKVDKLNVNNKTEVCMKLYMKSFINKLKQI